MLLELLFLMMVMGSKAFIPHIYPNVLEISKGLLCCIFLKYECESVNSIISTMLFFSSACRKVRRKTFHEQQGVKIHCGDHSVRAYVLSLIFFIDEFSQTSYNVTNRLHTSHCVLFIVRCKPMGESLSQ